MAIRTIAPALVTLVYATSTHGHYHILLPDKHSVRQGDTVTVTYQFGHPFEHELFDTEAPDSADVLAPDGKVTALGKSVEKLNVAAGGDKKVVAYRFVYRPQRRGDHVFLFSSPPVWVPEEKHFLQDRTKVVLHVETQKGWGAEVVPNPPGPGGSQASEILPLTRPYGLAPGSAFRIEVTGLGQLRRAVHADPPDGGATPVLRALVEVERFNAATPKELPADEQITGAARTDAIGTATVTLSSPGWWGITAVKNAGLLRPLDGKPYPVIQRATLWVHVDDTARGKTGE